MTIRRIISLTLCATILLLCASFSAFAAERGTVTVKSAQNLFEPFSRSVEKGESFNLAIKLRSDLMVVDGSVKLCFDSSCLRVTACEDGDKITSRSNITDARQTEDNSVISIFSAGAGFYDFTSESVLLTYVLNVIDDFSGDKEITVDFTHLTSNETYEKEGGVLDISVDGDVTLISNSTVRQNGFAVGAEINPLKGDVNLDGEVNINDVTELQLALVGSVNLSDAQKSVAQVYQDEKITIRDATMIQIFLAGFIKFL